MRKSLIALAVVFALAFGVGLVTTAPVDASSGLCFYKCVCPGVPVYCCVTPSGTSCKPAPNGPIQCPQVAC